MGLLDDAVVFISGGTRGLGAGIARAAVSAGGAVVVTGRRADIGDAFVREVRGGGGEATFVACDAGDLEQTRAAFAAGLSEYGRIDCLVNNAGQTSRGSLVDTTPELFDAHIAVNLRAPFFLMQDFVRARLDAKLPGTVVNIVSFSQHAGQPYLTPYVAAKAGLAGLTRNAAHASPLGPDPYQRAQHRLDSQRGRGRHSAGVPRRRPRLAGAGRTEAADGQTGPSGRDRRLRRVLAL
jgi:NAD(P)-dependent dehydrogenase (short-subunit alcohol dehydrogenase family)